MKRIVSLFLVAIMLLLALSGCSVNEDDKGSIIPMYLGSYQSNLDPTVFVYDKDNIKYTTLLYEGLTYIDEDGDIQKGLASEWYTETDKLTGEFKLCFKIANSRWSDGRQLIADHFVYAWKRLLSPEVYAPAASLLYDIKNARAVKSGDMTIDDLGLAAVDNQLLEVTFEKEIDPELFLEAVASPALVPVRDDVIAGEHIEDWAMSTENTANNGQFSIKAMEYGGDYILEKSTYYKTLESDEYGPNEFVSPYKLITDYGDGLSTQLEKFQNGETYYLAGLSKDDYAALEGDLETAPLLSTYTYFFNCKNGLLADPYARRAMSLALDRTAIAEAMGCGTQPATGLIPYGVYDSKMKSSSSFRKTGGDLISASANMEEAKNLMADVQNDSSEYRLIIRRNKEDQSACADLAVAAWKELGIKVNVETLSDKDFYAALVSGDFDIIGLDYQSETTSAYSMLAPFAKYYSGSVVSVSDDSEGFTPHITGFVSDEYDTAIDAVIAETTRAGRATKLHDAEALFTALAPAAPVVFYNDYYLVSDELDGLESTAFGTRIFTEAELDDYLEKIEAMNSTEEKK